MGGLFPDRTRPDWSGIMTLAAIIMSCAPYLAAFLFISSGICAILCGGEYGYRSMDHLWLVCLERGIFRKTALRRLNARG